MSFAIIDDGDTQKYTNEEIIKIEDKAYNQALEDLGNALCDDLDNGYVFMNKHQILHYVKKLKK